MGRPKIKIDYKILNKLCAIQCTQQEIADWFECSIDTIERAIKRDKGMIFAEYSGQKRKKGRISLRRKQWEVAMEGNVSMLIWIGKQYLGQTDKQEVTGGPEPIQYKMIHVYDREKNNINKNI